MINSVIVVSLSKGYSSDQMFDVVSEVQHYHTFVPWCKKSKVNFCDDQSLDTDLVIGFPPLFGEAYKVCNIKKNYISKQFQFYPFPILGGLIN